MFYAEYLFWSYQGGSDSVDNLRKRKTVSIGWCHLCQVDCESVEGLEMHRETHDYQRMYMDVVNNIRLKSARIAKLVLF